MVICCVPQCGTDSWRCDPSITFHDFPSSPDLAAKWIQQINTATKSEDMWFPRGKAMLCSKHFLSTDFRDDSDTLKPRVVPTVFGYKYIGENPGDENRVKKFKKNEPGPLIVKIKTEDGENRDILIPHSHDLDAILNEPENPTPNNSQISTNSVNIPRSKVPYRRSNMQIKHRRHNPVSPKVPYPKKVSNDQNNILEKSQPIPKTVQKRDSNDNLIEIGPNTFLKINPEIIKVNKKLTPSGNTVLQFLMDQNLANTIGPDVLPKIVEGAISNIGNATNSMMKNLNNNQSSNDNSKKTQHVLGHIVDTHVCEESCAKLQEIDSMLMDTDGSPLDKNQISKSDNTTPNTSAIRVQSQQNVSKDSNSSVINSEATVANDSTDSACIEKAPVLLTTNMSLAHCFMEKTKYLSHLRQKARQIASLKQKVASLNKKIEELEDKCIVQERQLSFSFLKRLKTIRKNASKGDPPATYILEQIKAYTGQKQMRWSDSTLHQCGIWCKKAPYAYEYFKKADFFKLPCLTTVKRFIKKHPERTFSNKPVANAGNEEEDSSSDFNFDEDSTDEEDKDEEAEKMVGESVLSEENSNAEHQLSRENDAIMNEEALNAKSNGDKIEINAEINEAVQNIKLERIDESKSIQIDGNNLELQEIILPSGEVVQCYGSNLSGEQYYIIPSTEDGNSGVGSEYSIIQSADSVPVVLQNSDGTKVHEELVFITDSTDQVHCPETEVVTDR